MSVSLPGPVRTGNRAFDQWSDRVRNYLRSITCNTSQTVLVHRDSTGTVLQASAMQRYQPEPIPPLTPYSKDDTAGNHLVTFTSGWIRIADQVFGCPTLCDYSQPMITFDQTVGAGFMWISACWKQATNELQFYMAFGEPDGDYKLDLGDGTKISKTGGQSMDGELARIIIGQQLGSAPVYSWLPRGNGGDITLPPFMSVPVKRDDTGGTDALGGWKGDGTGPFNCGVTYKTIRPDGGDGVTAQTPVVPRLEKSCYTPAADNSLGIVRIYIPPSSGPYCDLFWVDEVVNTYQVPTPYSLSIDFGGATFEQKVRQIVFAGAMGPVPP